MASRDTFVNVNETSVDYPDDETWNSMDEFGRPMPGTKAEQVLRQMVVDGRISPSSRGAQGFYSDHRMPGQNIFTESDINLEHSIKNLYPEGTLPTVMSLGFRESSALVQIYSKTIQLVRRRGKHRFEGHEYFDVSVQLSEWFATLPMQYRDIGLPPKMGTRGGKTLYHGGHLNQDVFVFLTAAYLHLLYNGTIILLNRPEMNFENFMWLSEENFQICSRAAESISEISQKVLDVDPNYDHVHIFVAFLLFESGMIHVVNCLPNAMPWVDPTIAKLARSRSQHNLLIVLTALERMMRWWATAERPTSLAAVETSTFVGWIFDRLGRKPVILATGLGLASANLATATLAGGPEDLPVYCRLSLGIEMNSDMAKRGWTSVLFSLMGGVGQAGIAAFALTTPNWRDMTVTISVLEILLVGTSAFFMAESEQWKFVSGTKNGADHPDWSTADVKATATVDTHNEARVNSPRAIYRLLRLSVRRAIGALISGAPGKGGLYTQPYLTRLLCLSYVWFASVMVSYGVAMDTTHLTSSLHRHGPNFDTTTEQSPLSLHALNILLVVISKPSLFLSSMCISLFGARGTIRWCFLLEAVVFTFAAVAAGNGFSATSGILMLPAEFLNADQVFAPTSARNVFLVDPLSALGIAQTFSKIGASFAPLVIHSSETQLFPMAFFGTAVGLAGIVVGFLPPVGPPDELNVVTSK
ncbi:hypothetical protein HDU93_004490 [Gonapodya sp. JEL0774]|nr:hypothetical protein HDU93_004490 [Gonapodya sp. JEL0774]